MRTKCHTCLCRTCLKTCCDRKSCKEKKESCKNYSGFRQLSIFEPTEQQKYKSAPRHSWQHYGISKERYRQLTEYIQSGKYTSVARQAAHTANKDIAEYILLSVKENLSYDELQKRWELKKIERMACCRTDFYGYRRLFYHLFDLEVRRIGMKDWNYDMDSCPLDTKVHLLSADDCLLLPQREYIGTLTFNGRFITKGELYKGVPELFYRSAIVAWREYKED